MNLPLHLAFNQSFFLDNYLTYHPKIGFRATTTDIFNDYIFNSARHAKGGGCAVGLTYR